MNRNLDSMLSHAKAFIEQSLAPRCETILSEVAISIHWAEGKAEILEGVTGRKYPKRKGWQNGTADLVCILKTGELLIADWKTGGTDGATEQLLSLGCGFQWCLLGPDLTKRAVRIACLRATEEGVESDERAVSDEQLAIHWLGMEIAWTGKDENLFDPVPGIHCTQLYCPHLAHCEAVAGFTGTAAAEDDRTGKGSLLPPSALTRGFRLTDSPRSDEEAGFVMAQIAAARRQQKYWESVMRKRVLDGERVVSGSYEWRQTGSGFRWGKVRDGKQER